MEEGHDELLKIQSEIFANLKRSDMNAIDGSMVILAIKFASLDTSHPYFYNQAVRKIETIRSSTRDDILSHEEYQNLFRVDPRGAEEHFRGCLLYTSPSPRDRQKSRMPSSA
eukprot:TRINITY_DN10039_c0_g1_i8.p1 TRINITY_DN10039_c0_g1~~TRINITY_DN10039_c0_g1_i8.p1  ORF type:complete len:112 (-),score=15.37 TRINITY_DN10039_c0_g1_i8:11-346(-)